MNIVYENLTRKIDSLGRVSIPSGLRSRYGINTGDEVDFSTMVTASGMNYIMISKDNGVDPKYVVAADVLKELGCEIPTKLENCIYNNACEGQVSLELK